ncbi:Hypothetical protein SCF082_LOCUS50128 [Durusdinium trenchii]|uniref:Uncharacterized protein n=1 Tax=Durusdinium trenchii TaxID=1381693 RepID=A0ABP0S5S7_9DINO
MARVLRTVARVSVALVLLDATEVKDLQRARRKIPGAAYKGHDQVSMSQKLNEHLKNAEGGTLPCENWSLEGLQNFMATVAEHRSTELQLIYRSSLDRRTLRQESLEDFRSQWKELNRIVSEHPHLHLPQKEAHCREAVMWWVHHLAEEKRQEFRRQNLTVPLLPEGPKRSCDPGLRQLDSDGGETTAATMLCAKVNEANSCDWCHSTQADHDKKLPGTLPPDALKKTIGPDDGNPQGWNRTRRCDQDQLPRCQLCEGVGGMAFGDRNEEIVLTPCEVVANASEVDPQTVAKPLYPKQFTIRRKDGKQGGYSDTLIGWKTDPFCFGFFPQNDSTKPMCYRSEDALVKYYDIEREAQRADYTIHNGGLFSLFPNITSTILHVQEQMWIQNDLWGVKQCICANPSGNHCTNPPCKAFVQHWDTFASAQYLGRERIGAEWIQDHGVGEASKLMELDHFILWAHHVWTDPVSKRLVRAWKPFNGLQLYDPEAWQDHVADPSVFDAPPDLCKKGQRSVRINCDDDGNYHPKKSANTHILDALIKRAASHGPEDIHAFAAQLWANMEVLV